MEGGGVGARTRLQTIGAQDAALGGERSAAVLPLDAPAQVDDFTIQFLIGCHRTRFTTKPFSIVAKPSFG